jgi:hypothetical protein
MDFDAVWDAWTAAGHENCGGWRFDPGQDGGVATCACGTVIPQAGELADENAGTP